MKVETTCNTCIFAVSNGQQQIGCKFQNRLQKFQAKGRANLQSDGFYIIDGLCNACRNQKWADTQVSNNYLKIVDDYLKVPVDLILLATRKEFTHKDINQAIKRLVKFKYKPNVVNLVLYKQKLSNVKLYKDIQMLLADTGIQYNITTVLEEDADDLRCVDIAFKYVKGQYYSVFHLDYNIPAKHIRFINKLINRDLVRMSMLEPHNDINGLTIQSILHKTYHGNVEMEFGENETNCVKLTRIQDKIRWVANFNNQQEMILDYE